MTMIETIISALVVAALSAITYFAYRHPKSYPKLYLTLTIALLFVMVALAAWDISNSAAQTSVLKVAENEEMQTMAKIFNNEIDKRGIADWVILIFPGCILYLGLLTVLPSLMREEEDED